MQHVEISPSGATHFPSRVMALGVLFAPNAWMAPFRSLFKCSINKSQLIFLSCSPCVLMNLLYTKAAVFLFRLADTGTGPTRQKIIFPSHSFKY